MAQHAEGRGGGSSGGGGRPWALVATCDRPGLLWRRCIPSILAQTVKPHAVVLVDDSKVGPEGLLA